MNNTLADIRKEFLNFFIDKGHKQIPSSNLIPDNDPTLMFTNAGMVQFKDVFVGKKVLPYKRATTVQKCLRAGGKHNDLENVGYTARHHTFFEMLGNFSFGDYFKPEVIAFAWELVTKQLCLPPERLLVTVHSSDEEAAVIWKKVAGFPEDKIIRIPTNDNFWAMGDTGPCGPCSEIFFDHGEQIKGGKPGTEDADGDRFVEIWNLVFMQFETLPDGSRIALPKPSIDTGMGLERIAAVLQGVESNFQIDLFRSLISDIQNITEMEYKGNEVHHHVIADHIRAAVFMISDGMLPSNVGSGYVLRRIIRRALRHGYALGQKEPFLFKLVDSVIRTMGEHYVELTKSRQRVIQILQNEEQGFMNTIENGMSILNKELQKLGSNSNFSPEVAYKLYDTFGFPFDLTQDILRSENKVIDEIAFQKLVDEQKERSKKAWVGTKSAFVDEVFFHLKDSKTEFLRNTTQAKAVVSHLIQESEEVVAVTEGEECQIILDRTPFYPESGGQIGDQGWISNDSVQVKILDTKKVGDIIVHYGKVLQGRLTQNVLITAKLDEKRRLSISRNHTATHLLHKAVHMVLGEQVFQQGSLVEGTRLRFDFCYNQSLSNDQLQSIEDIVIDAIGRALSVEARTMSKDEAVSSGAIALFAEKYPDIVRVVDIGQGFSKELCFGEHVDNTAVIGSFKIIGCSSKGANTQRIEAVTSHYVAEYFVENMSKLEQENDKMKSEVKMLKNKVEQLETQIFLNSVQTKQLGKFQLKEVENGTMGQIFSLLDSSNGSVCIVNHIAGVFNVVTKNMDAELQQQLKECFGNKLKCSKKGNWQLNQINEEELDRVKQLIGRA